MVLLREDRLRQFPRDNRLKLSEDQAELLGGGKPTFSGLSYGTSQAETLAAIGGLEAGSLVAVRLAEVHHVVGKPMVPNLLMAQEFGIKGLPLDSYTDCRDFYELSSGSKSVPQDKSQGLNAMAYREARIRGRLSLDYLDSNDDGGWPDKVYGFPSTDDLIPTESMTADGLTKSMVSPPLMTLLSAGMVEFKSRSIRY